MSRILDLWRQFSMPKKITLIGVLVATFAAFWFLSTASSRAPLALLYGGLDDVAAGEVIASLEAMDVRAEVRGNAIYVPKSARDSLRLALARQGLPQQGQPGFELLDDINGYATTSEMFNAAYWRAKEGELARTILSTPGVKSVRVHLAVPARSSFSRVRQQATASATLRMSGGRLDNEHAVAIRYLIALAVPELEPEQVAIIDAARGVILKPGSAAPVSDGADASPAQRLEAKLLDLLEARVGPGNARVTVSLDIDRERRSVTERILDPESKVLTTRDVSEVTESGTEPQRGVTIASNLPDGDAAAGPGEAARSERAETQEQTQYQYSEINRVMQREPGAVTRATVAVLLNDRTIQTEEGALQSEPRSEEELTAIRELVSTAVGFNEARGDIITVRSMSFHEIAPLEEGSINGSFVDYLKENAIAIVQVVVPAIIVLLLGLLVVKPVLTQGPAPDGLLALTGSDPLAAAGQENQVKTLESPVDEMRQLASSNAIVSAKVLKAWLGETEDVR